MLRLDVLAQMLQRLGRDLIDREHQPGLDDLARLIGRMRLAGGRLDDEPAAPGADLDDAARLQPHQRLAHEGARSAGETGQHALAKPRAGLEPPGQHGRDD